jgi:hypothetical protein
MEDLTWPHSIIGKLLDDPEKVAGDQGDQKIGGNFAQIMDKVAKIVAKPKNAKTSSSRLNLKVQNIYIKPF